MTPSARRTMRRALGLVLTVAALGGVAVVGPNLYSWERSRDRIVTDVDDAPSRDVAIIFGAEVRSNGSPSPYLRARLNVGVRLYKTGRVQVLVVSGDNSPAHHRETTAMRRYLERQGVPSGRIVEDRYGLDTYDTCARAKNVFGINSALLVSQSYHLPRAVATCRAVGVDAIGVGDESVRTTSPRWGEFSRREYPANVKMALDLVTARDPYLEPPSDAVARALNTKRTVR